MKFWDKFKLVNTRFGMVLLLVILLWAKSIFAYFVDFNLGVSGIFQYFILFINPLASAFFFLGISLYIRGKKLGYGVLFATYTFLSALLFANALYYREFSDFITINMVLGSRQVASGLGQGAIEMLRVTDIFYWLDFLVLVPLLIMKKIKLNERGVRGRFAIALSAFSIFLFSANLALAQMDRPQLLTRTFSSDYLVRYLSIPVFTAYDGIRTYQANQVRAQASENDLEDVLSFVRENHAAPNEEFFGIAQGKNVIYLHLESFQQFLIDFELADENGQKHVVTPFLNSLFHSKDTLSFENFFHQVGAGKTSDSETLLENSFFGLAQGSFFTQLGGRNTFLAMPAILRQMKGYTSAVFHGNAGNFWNRTNTYHRLGYDFFFDADYFELNDENSFQYGLHDSAFFSQSIQYLERLQQPFYTKFITVSNHFPYTEAPSGENPFPLAQTQDETINSYFAAANYLDRAIKDFFDYLKSSGLYENSIIILYGDHYGISNSRNPELAPLLNKSAEEWTDFDNAMLQRVPFMIHIPNSNKGRRITSFAGQIDVAPTLLHLLGIENQQFVQLGQDILSDQHNEIVVFRNGNIVTPEFTLLGSQHIYDTQTGQLIEGPSEETLEKIGQIRLFAAHKLAMSDSITNGDLLRFYTDSPIDFVNPDDFRYLNSLERMQEIERELGSKSTSLYSQHNR